MEMEITKVQLTEDGGYRVNDNMYVPNAPGNRHYAMVQEWLKEGNKPTPLSQAEIDRRKQLEGEAELRELDLASIRSIRSILLATPGEDTAVAKAALKNLDDQAQLVRERIGPRSTEPGR